MTLSPIMTDAEVAALFGLSVETLQRKMKRGFRPGETDLRKAEPEHLGRRRWWSRARVYSLIEK